MLPTRTTGHRPGVRLVGLALVAHLLVSLAHGVPHIALPIPLATWLDVVIALTVAGLPVAGFLLLWRGPSRAGAALFTLSVAAALLIGVLLHVVVPGPDNVATVPDGPWRLPFRLTAVGVAAVDGVATAAGAWTWRSVSLAGRKDADLPATAHINGVPAHTAGPATRLTYRLATDELGTVPEPVTLLAHHRGVLLGYDAMEFALDRAETVDDRLTELAVLKSAMVAGCEFCVDIGSALSRDVGVTEAQLRALGNFEESDAFSPLEKLVLRYATAMTVTPTSVPDELFDDLRAEFDETQLVELTAAIAFENFRARFNHAMGVESQDFVEGAYCPTPESVGGTTTAESTPERRSRPP